MDLRERRHLVMGKHLDFRFRLWVGCLGQPFIDIDIEVCISFNPLYIFIRILFVRSLLLLLYLLCFLFFLGPFLLILLVLYFFSSDFEIRKFD